MDIVLNEGKPGDVFRLLGENLSKACAFTNSMHQTDLLDTLSRCSLIGNVPDEVILFGVEPVNYKDMSAALSPELEAKLPEVMDMVLKEVEKAGGSYTPRTATNPRNGENLCASRYQPKFLKSMTASPPARSAKVTPRSRRPSCSWTRKFTIGDYIIIHAGFALRKLDPKEAQETLKILRDMVEMLGGEEYQHEML